MGIVFTLCLQDCLSPSDYKGGGGGGWWSRWRWQSQSIRRVSLTISLSISLDVGFTAIDSNTRHLWYDLLQETVGSANKHRNNSYWYFYRIIEKIYTFVLKHINCMLYFCNHLFLYIRHNARLVVVVVIIIIIMIDNNNMYCVVSNINK